MRKKITKQGLKVPNSNDACFYFLIPTKKHRKTANRKIPCIPYTQNDFHCSLVERQCEKN